MTSVQKEQYNQRRRGKRAAETARRKPRQHRGPEWVKTVEKRANRQRARDHVQAAQSDAQPVTQAQPQGTADAAEVQLLLTELQARYGLYVTTVREHGDLRVTHVEMSSLYMKMSMPKLLRMYESKAGKEQLAAGAKVPLFELDTRTGESL